MRSCTISIVPLLASLFLSACSGGSSSPTPSEASTSSGSTGGTSSAEYVCPPAQTSSGTLNCAALPLGDRKFSTTGPSVGVVYSCTQLSGKPVVESAPWIDAQTNTWSLPAKLAVRGLVSWSGSISVTESGSTRTITGNGLPISPYRTGTFPISKNDPAYKYDQNPNSIESQNFSFQLPLNPTAASSTSCLPQGPIGITTSGVAIYDAFDAAGYDGAARELQDDCLGHPDPSDTYHIHGSIELCTGDTGSVAQNSELIGYAFDGYGIYGPWYNGKVLTTKDLDQCHGVTSPIEWNGQTVNIYHYVATYDFPYSLSCYTGTPIHVGPATKA